jgi:recombination protein RecA
MALRLVANELHNEAYERFTSSLPAEYGQGFDLASFTGRLVEFSGWQSSARLTAAFGVVLQAQKKNEHVAWVTLKESSFFPPDVAAYGIDLDGLVVVRLADAPSAGRAADHLLRSNSFGLVVIDLPQEKRQEDRIPLPLLTRLLGLAQKHRIALLLLTEKPAGQSSLSSLVSLRAQVSRVRIDDAFALQTSILKDKRRGPGMDVPREICRGPAGLR